MARIDRRFKKKRSASSFYLIIFLLLAGAGGYGFVTYFEGELPLIEGKVLPRYLGKKSGISVTVSDQKSGLRSARVVIVQNGQEKEIYAKKFPRKGSDHPAGTTHEQINIELDSKVLGLKEGDAIIRVEARDYSFRGLLKGNVSQISHHVSVDTKPPKISIIHSERYIKPGGSGIVLYRVDDSVKHGVILNGNFHPGFPLIDESEPKYVSYIGLPYSTQKITEAVIVATDAAGNRSSKIFAPILNKANQKRDKINIGDSFLSKKVPEFQERYPEMEGDQVQKYLYTNREIRKMNNQKIHDLCLESEPKRLWSGRFLRMAGSGKAGFADHRTYFYKGQPIDKQVHLGMDIASTKHAEIKAAGTGKVIFGDYLGIYGNMVMLDHGQGVFSLYSHLSQINVAPGDTLNQGDILGNSGTSGMAGGDHLHFSMLVNGVFVTPKEWWDQHWIDVTIDGPIVDAKF